jgi:hypothetical protein
LPGTSLTAADEEFFETLPDGSRPPAVSGIAETAKAAADAAQQSDGALSGRIIYTCGGHGWTWGEHTWTTQRGIGHEMNEDYGNLDQMNFFVPYAFNAGATVVAFRPIGYQSNEAVLDNDSPGVKFSGKWHDSHSSVYFGKPNAVPYKFAPLDKRETATASYTPKIPAAGFYPVYTWVRHGPDRTSQLYRILHTGGETLVRVPHHMVGSGWVYLGTYYFEAGADRKRGSVVVSNLQPSPGFGAVAVADAIRFGNGMGTVVPAPGGHVSTYPREEEAARYWILNSLGQGQTNVIALDSTNQQSSNVSAPLRMARAMNRDEAGGPLKRVYLSFHSNSGGGRGAIGLWNDPKLFPGTKTPNQERFAELITGDVMRALLATNGPQPEVPWFKRNTLTYARDDYAFGEINNKVIEDRFDATILEVAFHDSPADAKLLRDPRVRDTVARKSCEAIVRYMNEFDGAPLRFLPAPPQNPRAARSAEGVAIAWDAPDADEERLPQYYLVYRSSNGYGFGRPVRVAAERTSVTLPLPPKGAAEYYRVTAVNAGGESLPSPVAGCRPRESKRAPRILFVNGFTEFDRLTNPRQSLLTTNYLPPSAAGRMDRVIPRLNNSFDYVAVFGPALAASGAGFDSCQRASVTNGAVRFDDYDVVVWAAGKQATNVLTPAESELLGLYVRRGGSLFLSGANVASAFAGVGNANAVEAARAFHVKGGADSGRATYLSFLPAKHSLFGSKVKGIFGNAAGETYFVSGASSLAPEGAGARLCLLYADGQTGAGVQYDGSAGGGKVVIIGFPFETIAEAKTRVRCLGDVLDFFEKRAR